MKQRQLIFQLLPTLFLVFISFMILEFIIILSSTTRYIGDILINSDSQLLALTQQIDSVKYRSYNFFISGISYYTYTLDNGQTILHYIFYSKDKNLPFEKAKE